MVIPPAQKIWAARKSILAAHNNRVKPSPIRRPDLHMLLAGKEFVSFLHMHNKTIRQSSLAAQLPLMVYIMPLVFSKKEFSSFQLP